jgi:hypothetical protein
MDAIKKPKKRPVRGRKARTLLAVAASLTIGSIAAVGCDDAPAPDDGGVITNPAPRDMARADLAGRD